jgi:hypothetical protein
MKDCQLSPLQVQSYLEAVCLVHVQRQDAPRRGDKGHIQNGNRVSQKHVHVVNYGRDIYLHYCFVKVSFITYYVEKACILYNKDNGTSIRELAYKLNRPRK